ncbi:hypothetical protein [Haloarchaeobius iranensis]|uniref:Uncharacterized protein n=1 Tax=Haloarchaeobius iranensis TaxID=996166 RepID=A0A1G9Y0J9_9EURY|nr:hypothetical protein [Haloarchaeobius iranensis]SDN02171.1 hypothetical protein SAMN05192554_11266 [Haloarchaeobius iranensis]
MPSRRSLLAAVGSTVAVSLTGCQMLSGNGDGTATKRQTTGRATATTRQTTRRRTDTSTPTETDREAAESPGRPSDRDLVPYPIIGYQGSPLVGDERSNAVAVVASQSDWDGLSLRDDENWVWRGEHLRSTDIEEFIESTDFDREYVLVAQRRAPGSTAELLVTDIDRVTDSHVRADITVTDSTLTDIPLMVVLVRVPIGSAPAPDSATVYFSTPDGDDVVES